MGLASYFYPVATSRELDAEAPLARALFGKPVVIFRDGEGKAKALLNRCAHRNFPLSTGKVLAGELRCNYHGWRFDGRGRCTAVPGLDTDDSPLPKACVPSFAARERDGLVWVWGEPEVEPTREPLALPLVSDASYWTDVFSFGVAEASLERVLENFMDVAHPPFVHPGLLNADEGRQHIRVRVAKYAGDYGTGIEGDYLGEKLIEASLFMRLFADKRAEAIVHRERFLAPTHHQLEFRFGDATHALSTQLCTPEAPGRVRLHIVCHLKLRRLPHGLAAGPFRMLLKKLITQDLATLRAQERHIESLGGEAYGSSKLDTFGLRMLRFLKHLEEGKRPEDVDVATAELPLYV